MYRVLYSTDYPAEPARELDQSRLQLPSASRWWWRKVWSASERSEPPGIRPQPAKVAADCSPHYGIRLRSFRAVRWAPARDLACDDSYLARAASVRCGLFGLPAILTATLYGSTVIQCG